MKRPAALFSAATLLFDAHAVATVAPVASGTIELTPPPGAIIARDEGELRRLLEDGPSEIWLAPRTYRTDLKIHRRVALRGVRGATIEGTRTQTVVRIEADDVELENVTIRASGRRNLGEDAGVRAAGAGVAIRNVVVEDTLFGVILERCVRCTLERSVVRGADMPASLRGDGIKLWESHDSTVRDNHVEHVRDVVVWYSRRVVCERNHVLNSRYGTHFMYAHDSVARDSRLIGNAVGIFVMYSSRLHLERDVVAGARGAAGMGIGFKESDGVVIVGTSIAGNTTGIYLDRSPRDPREKVSFDDNVFAANDVAIRVHGAAGGVAFHGNDFRANTVVIEVDGGGDALGLDFSDNYWSEYDGYDLDGDGRGDIPHEVKRYSSELVTEEPSVRFLHGTLALQLVDALARAFPLVGARPLIVDRTPALRPHRARRP